uniref:Uncharacterized protein n=1 Tax=Opuntia streptacantha TaxID=393608 RepID=A0A7C9CTX9_OPUST
MSLNDEHNSKVMELLRVKSLHQFRGPKFNRKTEMNGLTSIGISEYVTKFRIEVSNTRLLCKINGNNQDGNIVSIVTRIAHSPTVPCFGSSDLDRGSFPYWNEGGCVPDLRIARSLF